MARAGRFGQTCQRIGIKWDKAFVHRSGSVTRSFGTHSLGQAHILFARWRICLSRERSRLRGPSLPLQILEERSLPVSRLSTKWRQRIVSTIVILHQLILFLPAVVD